MVPDLLVVDLDQYNENLYQIINKLILKTENIHIEIYLSTVNPLLSPPGAYFLQALLRWGGLNREGGLKERCGGGGGAYLRRNASTGARFLEDGLVVPGCYSAFSINKKMVTILHRA